MAMEIKNAIQKELGDKVLLPATLSFEYPSIDKLANYLDNILKNDSICQLHKYHFTISSAVSTFFTG